MKYTAILLATVAVAAGQQGVHPASVKRTEDDWLPFPDEIDETNIAHDCRRLPVDVDWKSVKILDAGETNVYLTPPILAMNVVAYEKQLGDNKNSTEICVFRYKAVEVMLQYTSAKEYVLDTQPDCKEGDDWKERFEALKDFDIHGYVPSTP